MNTSKRHRSSYLTVSEHYNLNLVCKALAPFGYGIYHVGSSLIKQNYHDVDLRCILEDSEYDHMFGKDCEKLLFLNTVISEWIGARTGLPIDFQFQKATEANEKYNGRRNALGH